MNSQQYGQPFDDVFICVPEEGQIIRIAEGTGDNLLKEDIELGYNDYVYYDVYDLDQDMPVVEDGGMMLTKKLVRDEYEYLAMSIPDILDMVYEDSKKKYILLKGYTQEETSHEKAEQGAA